MKNREDIITIFNNFSEEERCIFHALSVINISITQGELLIIFRQVYPENKLNAKGLQQKIKHWRHLGVLKSNCVRLDVDDEAFNYLIETFVKEEYFDTVWGYVLEFYPVRDEIYGDSPVNRCKRNLIVYFYKNDPVKFSEAHDNLLRRANNWYFDNIQLPWLDFLYFNLLENKFDALCSEIRTTCLNSLLNKIVLDGDYDHHLKECTKKELLLVDTNAKKSLSEVYIRLNFLAGNFKEIEEILIHYPDPIIEEEVRAVECLLTGKTEESIQYFESNLKKKRKSLRKTTFFHGGQTGLLHLLALLLENKFETIKKANTYLKKSSDLLKNLLTPVFYFLENQESGALFYLNQNKDRTAHCTTDYFFIVVRYWILQETSQSDLLLLKEYLKELNSEEQPWMWFQMQHLLSKSEKLDTTIQQKLQQIEESTNWIPLINRFQKKEKWVKVLDSLERRFKVSTTTKQVNDNSKRIVWLFDKKYGEVRPIEQSLGKSNKWSKGRRIALKKLFEEEAPIFAIKEDIPLIKTIQKTRNGGYWGAKEEWEINDHKAWKHLVGHPNVFLENAPETRCDFILEKPALIVEKEQDELLLKIEPELKRSGIYIEEITPTKFRIVDVDINITIIYETMGGNSFSLPNESKDRLSKVLLSIAEKINVQSDVFDEIQQLKELNSTNSPCIHLLPLSNGICVQLYMKPIENEPIYFKFGERKSRTYATINEEKVVIKRNLKLENKNKNEILQNCPILKEQDDGTDSWEIDDLQLSLQLLLELQSQRDQLIIEWPKGEKLRITSFIQPENIALAINKEKDWFNISGDVVVNDKVLMKLEELLRLNQEKQVGNFIELGNGEFLALTNELKKKLTEISTFTTSEKNEIKLNSLTSLLFQDLEELMPNTITDEAWKKQKKRISTAYQKQARVPSTLQADLRFYQKEGYEWLSQLYDIGAGACLADDMGLGKTIQTIALLVEKAKNGPSFVIAPSSVVPNWESEINKFSPVLQIHNLNDKSREIEFSKLKSFDIVIGSYGILQQQLKKLTKVKWNIISLDEAQAIKNSKTKRSEAVMSLSGKFKMVTTGTPIENHLGELWNLFNFINSGLLGTSDSFQRKFIAPIEKENSNNSRLHLQKLIKPFILRRRKSEVLQELPPKTEITLHVDLSEEEKAFYEAYRLKVIQDLESESDEGQSNNMKVLAEITKLRQLSCNVKLVEPNSTIKSSKLSLLENVLKEILTNNHRVLIFSQFVTHLKLIKEKLNELDISYQYLDGQTPIKKRKERVDAFQTGEGEVFLISLKAGGTGLNLTAADYVIHMDPWWNPAVEDQASDRVHRIGQQRPVTIYRLVSKETIEEKIIKLHKSKRDLAEGLLEGTNSTKKVNMQELLSLMKD